MTSIISKVEKRTIAIGAAALALVVGGPLTAMTMHSQADARSCSQRIDHHRNTTAKSAGLTHRKLKPAKSLTVTQNGATISDLDVTGTLKIRANNVTIRNVRVRSNTKAYALYIDKGFSGTKIINSEVKIGTGGNAAHAGIGGIGDHGGKAGHCPGDNITVINSRITGHGDGVKIANNSLYAGNYIKLTRGPKDKKAHIDGMQSSGMSNWAALGNNITIAGPGQTAPIFVQAYSGKKDKHVRNIWIENNHLTGGVYAYHSEDGKKKRHGGYLKKMRIHNNILQGGKYGHWHVEGKVSGNIGHKR